MLACFEMCIAAGKFLPWGRNGRGKISFHQPLLKRKEVKLNSEGQSEPWETIHWGKGALGMVGGFTASLFMECSRLGCKTHLREMQNKAYGK